MLLRRAAVAAFLSIASLVGAVAAPPRPAGAVTITTGNTYVSMGDSITAGATPWYAGAGDFAGWALGRWIGSGFSSWSHLCGRAINNPWPSSVKTQITASGSPTWKNASCSGALTNHLYQTQYQDTVINGIQPINPAQTSYIDSTTKAVTITIGGNDAELLRLINDCTASTTSGPGTGCTSTTAAVPWNSILTGGTSVQSKITTAFNAVAAALPSGAKVKVVLYPAWVPDTTVGTTTVSPTACSAYNLDSTEVAFIASKTRELNQALTNATAGRTGWSTVDAYGPSQAGPRHDMCSGATNKWITGPFSGEYASVAWLPDGSGMVYPLHLNDAGHAGLASIVGPALLAA